MMNVGHGHACLDGAFEGDLRCLTDLKLKSCSRQRELPVNFAYSVSIRIRTYIFKSVAPFCSFCGLSDLNSPVRSERHIDAARTQHDLLAEVGFGSLCVGHPGQATEKLLRAVKKAGVRCVMAGGWAGIGPHCLDSQAEDFEELRPGESTGSLVFGPEHCTLPTAQNTDPITPGERPIFFCG